MDIYYWVTVRWTTQRCFRDGISAWALLFWCQWLVCTQAASTECGQEWSAVVWFRITTPRAATWHYAHHHQPEHHQDSDCFPRPRCVVWWRALNAPTSVPAVTDMLLSLAPHTFRKSATRPWCHSQAGVGVRAVASWLLQRRPNRTSSLDTGAVAESPQCSSTGCGRPGTTWSRDSFPLRAVLVADCRAYWLLNLPSGSGTQVVVCWPSTWLHYRTVDTCGKRSFTVITEIIKQQQPDRSAG